MPTIYTTEITSDKLASDNPLHQRLLKPYSVAGDWVKGDLLENADKKRIGLDRTDGRHTGVRTGHLL